MLLSLPSHLRTAQLDARGRRLQPDHVARLPQQLHQPAHLHHLQPGVQESLQAGPRPRPLAVIRVILVIAVNPVINIVKQ